jgi:cleavage and polyadenylation specificity factor subunit 3
MMFLEAQFGADNVSPIADPKHPPPTSTTHSATTPPPKSDTTDDNNNNSDTAMNISSPSPSEEERDQQQRQAAELARLHRLGIPVPGVRIRVDKMEASVWLEGLEVECGNRVFADRVRAVVERAVEVGAPLWG